MKRLKEKEEEGFGKMHTPLCYNPLKAVVDEYEASSLVTNGFCFSMVLAKDINNCNVVEDENEEGEEVVKRSEEEFNEKFLEKLCPIDKSIYEGTLRDEFKDKSEGEIYDWLMLNGPQDDDEDDMFTGVSDDQTAFASFLKR